MNLHTPKIKSEIIHHLQDPLFKNSLFIMLTSVSSAGFGLIFWMLAAKFYPAGDVGIATALISSMTMLVLLSRFGLDFSIIRFFPVNDKSRIFSTSVIITTLFAVLFGVIFIAGVDILSPKLHILKSLENTVLFLIILAASSVTALTANSFIAIRKAGFQLFQSFIIGSRVIFLFPLIALGEIGIFGAVGISLVFAVVAAFILLVRSEIRPALVIDRSFLNDAFHYSAGNYLAGLFITSPNLILPVIVLNTLGAEQAAYYYIAFAIAALLFMIPTAISMSLFVEGSHGEALKKNVVKSMFAIFVVLVPIACVLYVYGGWVLGIMGADYAGGGFGVLRMMVVASLFIGLNQVYFAIMRIQKDVWGLVMLSGVVGGLVVGLAYVFMVMFGVVGVGYAWLVGNGVGSVCVGMMVWRKGRV